MLCSLIFLTLASLICSTSATAAASYPFPWLDPSLPIEQRVSSFIANLTVDDKVNLLQNSNPAIPRIGLAAYDWWSEASHGVAWIGKATAFPSPIALASSWNVTLQYGAGRVVSTEGRALHNDYTQQHNNDSDTFYGVNFFAPNVNMFIHAQWGRGQETFGEDPVLTGRLAAAYVQGIQGNASGEEKYLQAGATAKHFFVFNYANGINGDSVNVSTADLRLTYLPAFKTLVQKGKVESVMCSYKSVQTKPNCDDICILFGAAANTLLTFALSTSRVLDVSVLSMVRPPVLIPTCRRCCVMSGALRALSSVTWAPSRIW